MDAMEELTRDIEEQQQRDREYMEHINYDPLRKKMDDWVAEHHNTSNQ